MTAVENKFYGLKQWRPELCTWDPARGSATLLKLQVNPESEEADLADRFNFPSGLAFDGKNLWYLELNSIADRYRIHSIQLAELVDVVIADSLDKGIFGIAFGADSSGRDRVWISSVREGLDTLQEPRGRVYVIAPDALRMKKLLDPQDSDVVLSEFEGFWHHLAYDSPKGELWGLDRTTMRICRLNIDSAAPPP